MKKLVISIISLSLALSLFITGCGEATTEPSTTSPAIIAPTTNPPEATEPPIILPTETDPQQDEAQVQPVIGQFDESSFDDLSTERHEHWFGKMQDDGFPQVYHDSTRELIEKYDGILFGDTSKKEIMLTFDCGYEYENLTDTFLDILKKCDVKAVFFVTLDYVRDNPDKIQRMIDEGHIVGNHSASHPDFTTLSVSEMKDDVMELHDYVKDNFDYTMTLFRFPAGNYNERALAVLKSLGYKCIFWSFAYADWDTSNQKTPQDALDAVCHGMHNGTVALLHAVSVTNSVILEQYIGKMKTEGYRFVLN